MSQENVHVARAVFDRFNQDQAMPEELFHAEVELSNVRESPLPGPYRGHAGLRRWRDDLFEVVEEGRFDVNEVVDAAHANAVVIRVRLRGRAKHTGIDVDFPFSIVSWFREARIYRSVGYTDQAEALEAAGLSE